MDDVKFVRASEPTGIRIVCGTGEPFDKTHTRLHMRDHCIRVLVENPSPSRSLTNCKLELTRISGALAQRCPVQIKPGFILNPGGKEYIEIASYEESRDSHPRPNDPGMVELHFGINPLRSSGRSYLENNDPHDLVLTASAAESPPHVQNCRLWIKGGILTLEPI
jgi:hypothetical protein